MVEIQPTDGPGQFALWQKNIERRLNASDTARRTPFTDFYDEDGNLLGSLSAEGLRFFNADGDPITRLDGDGLVVYDAGGTPQLRAGRLTGSTYGVEIGGGRLRALDYTTDYNLVSNVLLTTSEAAHNEITITPPSWATASYVTGQLGFQMSNSTGGTQRMYFRVDINGNPGEGLWTNYVPDGMTANTSDTSIGQVTGNSPFNVSAIVGVNTGTNSVNHLRLGVSAIFLR